MLKFVEDLLQGAPVEWQTIDAICSHVGSGGTPSTDVHEYYQGNIPWLRTQEVDWKDVHDTEIKITPEAVEHSSAKLIPANCVIVAMYGATAAKACTNKIPLTTNQACCNLQIDEQKAIYKYVYYWLCREYSNLKALGEGSQSNLNAKKIKSYCIPLPPLHVQGEIVRILDKYSELETELEAALATELKLRKQQYEYYRNQLLTFGDEVEWKPLGEVAQYEQPTKYLVQSSNYKDEYPIPVLTAGKTFILGYTDERDGIYKASVRPVIIFDDFTMANKWVNFDFKAKSSAMKMITSKNENAVLLKYIYYWLNRFPCEPIEGDHKRQWISNYANKKIPLPPLPVQEEIVAILDKFDTLVNSLSEGLPKEIALRRQQYEYYREQLLTFPRPQ